MIAASILLRPSVFRSALLLALCAALAPLAACKKKEAAAPAGDQPAAEQPAEQTPKEEPATELKPKWPAGRRLVVQLATHTDTEMTNPVTQQPLKTENFLTQEFAFSPGKERAGGGCEVEVEVVSVRSENKAAGKTTPIFDPKGDPKAERNNPLAGAFRKLMGSRVKYQTDAEGKITKVDGLPQLTSKVTTGIPPQLPAFFIVRSLVSEDAIKGWNVLHQNLPTNSVKGGETWESTRDLPFGVAKFALTATNTFKGWEQRNNKKMARIETAGIIGPKEGAPAAAITLGDGATVAGTAWYDPDLGIIAESDVTAQFTVNIAQASGQTTSSKLKTKTTSKLVETGDSGGNAGKVMEKPAAAKTTEQKQ